MPLLLNNLKSAPGSTHKKKRVGRGNASGHGTYSGQGQKGQKARSGGRRGLKRKGLTQLLHNKPKIGGFSSGRDKMINVNIGELEKLFENGSVINPQKLLSAGIIKTAKPGIKILGEGKLTKKFNVVANSFSQSAKDAIIKAGGKVQKSNKR